MPQKQLVVTAIALPSFVAPNTASRREGRLPRGEYPVIEVKKDQKTTYVSVLSGLIDDGSSWLCIRSHPHHYGTLITREVAHAERPAFEQDEHAVDESELHKMCVRMAGWTYDRQHPRYPDAAIGSLDLKKIKAPPNVNNCCTFVEALVAGVFAQQHAQWFTWDDERHGQMMINAPDDDRFSPVSALLLAGAAVPGPVDDLVPPSPWTVFQGWTSKFASGHTFIVVDHDEKTDKCLVLESNSTSTLNGVGWRGIGQLGKDGLPPKDWNTRPDVWTWQRLMAFYPHRHRCHLRVKHRKLAGLG